MDSKIANETVENFFVCAFPASLVLMISGTVLGWSSPVLPKLQGLNSTLPVTENEGTWVGSLVAIGAIVGPFPAGKSFFFVYVSF